MSYMVRLYICILLKINIHVKPLLPHNSFQYMYMHYLQFTLTDARQPVLARTLETPLCTLSLERYTPCLH